MIKAVIFDFDGLIIDTETIWYESFREIMKQEHQHELSIEDYSACIGTSSSVLYEFLQQAVPEMEEERMKELTNASYMEKATRPELRPGVLAYLEAAKKNGLKIGLASSSGRDWVVGYLKQLDIFSYFETIVTRDDVEKVKPDPALYIKALQNLGKKGEEAIAFEDSLHGSHAAMAAGIHCIVVPNPVTSHMDFKDYHLRLSSMEEKELEAILEDFDVVK
ncbi:putative hydrolase of the HAD superfamily [Bacillus tianshenii]|uniref:Hydrolase of the HAD superfamily n=1 Tax=Sutcliffiella tianshenii TaxID=1463404 RepID=A0ABS2P4A5_9BACI|nr:putative hydrolase of the HAD superfamily [Bacillus tianshenii]